MSDEKEFWEKKLMEFERTILYKIEELKFNFDDHTHLVWFNKIKELEEEDDHIKHIINVNRTGVSNLFTNYGEIKELLAKLSGSGGEKKGEAEIRMEPSCNFKVSTDSDSKPPEPKYKCIECGEWFKAYHDGNGWQNWVCSKCYPRINTTGDRLPGGTGTEPREDDVINIREMVKTLTNKEWVLVKREDLLTLYNLASWYNPDAGDLNIIRKRIKEVYSL